jgi:hypothetical protein
MISKILEIVEGKKTGTILIALIVFLNFSIFFNEKNENDILSSLHLSALFLTIILLITNLLISKYNNIFRLSVSMFLLLYCSFIGYQLWDFFTHFD